MFCIAWYQCKYCMTVTLQRQCKNYNVKTIMTSLSELTTELGPRNQTKNRDDSKSHGSGWGSLNQWFSTLVKRKNYLGDFKKTLMPRLHPRTIKSESREERGKTTVFANSLHYATEVLNHQSQDHMRKRREEGPGLRREAWCHGSQGKRMFPGGGNSWNLLRVR